MKRRTFIMLLGSAATWPLDTLAQQGDKVWRMGFIAHGHESFYDALFEGLREYGYEEGRNLIVERRYAHGAAERFKEFAAEMVRLNVDVIVVVTTPAALAVMNATFTATSRRAVDEAYAAAISAGAEDEGAPGLRPDFGPNYYGAYVRDLDGNKLHFVCRGEEATETTRSG
jgi:predicted lactoylglutathione lyase